VHTSLRTTFAATFVALGLMSQVAQAAAPAQGGARPSAPAASAVQAGSLQGDHAAPRSALDKRKDKRKTPAKPEKLVDINGASRKELMTLPGIGGAEADKIIAARPFLTKAELVTKGVLPAGPYVSMKNKVVALQKQPPKLKR
jgi:DNA uptake protein ComE-like DNA-binding protein